MKSKRPINNVKTDFPVLDFSSWWYRNCVSNRRRDAKICRECPFREGIEEQEERRRGVYERKLQG